MYEDDESSEGTSAFDPSPISVPVLRSSLALTHLALLELIAYAPEIDQLTPSHVIRRLADLEDAIIALKSVEETLDAAREGDRGFAELDLEELRADIGRKLDRIRQSQDSA